MAPRQSSANAVADQECPSQRTALSGRNGTLFSVVGTARRECLDRMLILGRRHLEAVLGEYVEHYNRHRPHRSLSQQAPSTGDTTPVPTCEADSAHLQRTDFLGGLIHEYRMVA
jgi:hypothetical protein